MCNMRKEIGKIERVTFGLGGYQDGCIGIYFILSSKSWATRASMDAWDASKVKVGAHTKWTESDRDAQYGKIVRYVSELLNKAGVDSVDKLRGIPIEATFDEAVLMEWRILEEVL